MRGLLLLALTMLLPAQEPAGEDPTLADFSRFTAWLNDYREGAFRLVREGMEDEAAVAQVQAVVDALARWNTLIAARKLFEAAAVDPKPPGASESVEAIAFYREVQPWKVRAIAIGAIAKMQAPEIDSWLAERLSQPLTPPEREAALRILADRGSAQGLVALLEASGRWPKEERVRAVAALARAANLDLVPRLLELSRDVEPNARIAAIDGLCSALAPHTDETQVPPDQAFVLDPELAKVRDRVLARLKEVLVGDKIWQVRAAAGEGLASLRCKEAIPVLIAGLQAEHNRKKDPWAMDLRLHRLLERMTGQKMLPGQPAAWQEFWRREGSSMRLVRNAKVAEQSQKPGARQYAKFFALDLETDRVLFVLDFSGSMAEEVTLKATTTAAQAGTRTTKAKLVVEELKKIVASLPDKTMLNFVIFSDEVRVWRELRDGRPALVALDDETRDDLLGTFLDSLRPAGATNLYGALDRALEFAGRGLHDKYYETGFDTLYVLSDGAPSAGKVIDRDEILRLVRDANRLRKLTIHTVTFGDQNETKFLGELATQNNGRHVHVE